MESLAELRLRRERECRLAPDLALESLDDAEAFLTDRWLLTRTPDCALPSLYEACHEDPYRPGSPGFASWPATKWPWFTDLAGRGYLVTALHRGKNLMLSPEGARLADPICRAEIARMRAADPGWRTLLDHLDAAGPSLVDDLITELRLKRKELNALRSPLERCGAIVSRPVDVTSAQGHPQSRELVRWDQAYLGPRAEEASPVRAAGDLLVAGVRAAVLAPEQELRRWFSWTWYVSGALTGDLIAQGRLRRAGGDLVTVAETV